MACIDAHAHLALRPGATEKLIQSMDRHGIDRTFVVGGGLVSPGELSRRLHDEAAEPLRVSFDNEKLLEECEPHRPRLLPFYFANPWEGSARYRATGGRYHGLKLAPGIHGMPLGHPVIHELFAGAEAHGHPVYLHCLAQDGFRVEDLAVAARAFPAVTFILGHAGIGNLDFHGVDVIASVPNVLFETSGGFQAVIVHAVKVLGIGRVLFGSEYPLQDPAAELVKIANLPLAPAEIERIRSGNAEALVARGTHVS